MKRIVNKAKNFIEAEDWDIKQNIRISSKERQNIARRLKERVYGKDVLDVRDYYGLNPNNKDNYFSNDVKEFLFLLARYSVRYVIVGGEAVIYYGYARLTGDIDIFYENSEKNIKRLFTALKEFWNNSIPGIRDKEELKERGVIVQFGVPPNRIVLINYIDGVEFKSAWKNRITEHISFMNKRVPIYFIGIEELIENKKRLNRPKDIEDLKYLMRKARDLTKF